MESISEFLLNGVEIYNLDPTEVNADLTMNTQGHW